MGNFDKETLTKKKIDGCGDWQTKTIGLFGCASRVHWVEKRNEIQLPYSTEDKIYAYLVALLRPLIEGGS